MQKGWKMSGNEIWMTGFERFSARENHHCFYFLDENADGSQLEVEPCGGWAGLHPPRPNLLLTLSVTRLSGRSGEQAVRVSPKPVEYRRRIHYPNISHESRIFIFVIPLLIQNGQARMG